LRALTDGLVDPRHGAREDGLVKRVHADFGEV
jgi:hypothetical protein